MTHKYYVSIEADSYFELGQRRGEVFGDFVRDFLRERIDDEGRRWRRYRDRARRYQDISRRTFPHLFDELRGFAQVADVDFDDLWLMSLEDEVAEFADERCTTIVTNDCAMVAHNEDWEREAADSMCVLRWKMGDLSMFELSYMNTIGGNAISVNSHGYIHTVNALLHTDYRIGVPKNLVARWLSETSSPDRDYEKLQRIRRASGFHHTIVNMEGGIWSIECSATRQVLDRPKSPFVHTNHFLSRLSRYEDDDEWIGTQDRYRTASKKVRDSMTADDMQLLVGDQSQGKRRSILNHMTIARMIVDVRQQNALVWMLREEEKGWVTYDVSVPS